jgi:16S rRNA C1402 (ribose-2'-O) methylase RsmI
MTTDGNTLILIPWHIGNILDVTYNAVRTVRRLRLLLVEDPELTRRQFEHDLKIDCREKEFLAIPEEESQPFAEKTQARLRTEDVGLLASSGAPCFIDPGAWLVRRLISAGVPVVSQSGASILSNMLSLSGVDWTGATNRGTFVLYLRSGPGGGANKAFLEAVGRQSEPVFIFLGLDQFRECLTAMAPVVGNRPVTAFFDLTKVPRSKFPFADRLLTVSCREWLQEANRINWHEISDVSLMVHPEGS